METGSIWVWLYFIGKLSGFFIFYKSNFFNSVVPDEKKTRSTNLNRVVSKVIKVIKVLS